jgi:hypothetical protein
LAARASFGAATSIEIAIAATNAVDIGPNPILKG